MNRITAPANDLLSAQWRASVIAQLPGLTSTFVLDGLYRQERGFSPIDSGLIQGSSIQVPIYWAVDSANNLFVFLSGLATAVQGQAVWNGYLGNSVFPNSADTNPWFVAAGQAAWALISGQGQPANVFIVGWSAGYCVGWHLAFIIQAAYPRSDPITPCAASVLRS